MIIPHSILEEFISWKFPSLYEIAIENYNILSDDQNNKILFIIFTGRSSDIEDYHESLIHFRENIFFSDFMTWLGERRLGRLDELGI
jgi:hypothetical protein